MSFDRESLEGLLDDEKTSNSGEWHSEQDSFYQRTVKKPNRHLLFIHFFFWAIYSLTFVAALVYVLFLRPYTPTLSQHARNSPIRDAVSYETRTVGYNFDETNAFHGQPLEDIEQEWSKLMNGGSDVRVSSEGMRAANLSSIQLADGSGDYIVKPIAYHMLHCLYTIYRYTHPDFYGEDPGGRDWVVIHTDHCIDNLRQFVQCHAGDGVNTWRWLNKRKLPWPVLSTEETCVNWNQFGSWVQEHSVENADIESMKDGHLLVHPTLGPITPDDLHAKVHVHAVHSPEDFD